ncbi:hypothetical protein [Micromonospora humi]|uniref:Uncharacterized protein n=1 Tax=Micromonospora humi TaxID=745366 RepID=A0A1C5K054_9ACTN|nr:hypothetical protein [Micromonospora humi]SCG75951.1 hypothetical protein GA0070213_11614 [Micromonospora humi]
MPASVAPADKRTPTLLTVLFWIGVGLAPLAALILLIADGNGTLRFGAVLAILAVVLIGLSIALRAENGADAEELREELEELRRELRAEIVAAAQRGNQALDQARRAEEAAGAVRHRLDAAAAGLAAAPAEERPGGRARVPLAGAYEAGPAHPTGRAEHEPGGRYGADQRAEPARAGRHDVERTGADGYAAEGRARPEPRGAGRDRSADHDEEHPGFAGHAAEPARPAGRASAGVYGAARAPEPGARPASRPVGVVHHTETVHVTTRHTIVGGGEPSGSRYGGFSGRWSPQAEDRQRGAEPAEYRDAGRDDRVRSGADPDGWPGSLRAASGAERSWPGGAHDDHSRDDGSRAGGSGGGWTGDGSGRAGDDGSGWAGDGSGWAGNGSSWGGDGSGRAGGEHPWSGVGRAVAEERGRPSRAADDGWSAGDDRAWPVDEPPAPAGPYGRAEADGRAEPVERYGRAEPVERYGRAEPDERYGRAEPDERYGRAVPVERSGRVASVEPGGEDWSELRAGSRWAAVRDDGQGREYRVGERRAAVHADGDGTEYRVEDRWAAIRGAPGEYGGSPRHDPEPSYGGSASPWHDPEPSYGAGRSPESPPALPAGGVSVPDEWRPPTQRSGQPEWRRPEPEWRQPEPQWRQPEPEWRRPEPGTYGQPPGDHADRWR